MAIDSRVPLRFASYNVRFDNPADAEAGHGWSDRLDRVVALVEHIDPDVLGLQEVRLNQLADLVRAFSGFRSIGKPRQAGVTGEYVPIFVRTDRLELEQWGDFWLSITPEIEASIGWDAPDPRHCTWATMHDRHTGATFATFNTHLDVWGEQARVEGARLIGARRNLTGGLPAVVMGDFNAGEGSEPLRVLCDAGLRDTYREIHPEGPAATFPGFTPSGRDDKLDYVLCDGHWHVVDACIVPDGGGAPASDHLPILADLVLTGAGPGARAR